MWSWRLSAQLAQANKAPLGWLDGEAGRMTTATVVSLLVALAALVISAASFWRTALKPAAIQLDFLPEYNHVDGGGMRGVPALYGVRLTFALVNLGARAGLLHGVDVVAVSAPGARDFASGIHGPDGSIGLKMALGDQPASFPVTVEPGEVRSLSIELAIAGPFLSEASTERLGPNPSREPLARMLAQLKQVEFSIVWSYQRQVGILRSRSAAKAGTATVRVPGQLFREKGVEYWKNSGQAELTEIALRTEP